MIILSINAGSSSLKFAVYKMPEQIKLGSGVFERIGLEIGKYTIKYNDNKYVEELKLENHTKAVEILVKKLVDLKIINNINEIEGIGNRVVQGGDKFFESVIVDKTVIDGIKELYPLGPLHNPGAIAGIEGFRNALPNVENTVIFDTAFHQTIEEENYLYPVPEEWYTKYGVRRYGFHGTSHRYLTEKISQILNKENIKIISCHLGNGASIAAIENGKCKAVSMGFTPLSGLVMGSRCGNVDPSAILYMMDKLNVTPTEMTNILNKESGILAITNESSDFRDLEVSYNEDNKKAIIAVNMFVRKIVNYIASYNCLLEGTDVIVFSAGIGENSCFAREKIVEKLSSLGIFLDKDKNNNLKESGIITTNDSKIQIYVLPTDEELMIARDTYNLINRSNNV